MRDPMPRPHQVASRSLRSDPRMFVPERQPLVSPGMLEVARFALHHPTEIAGALLAAGMTGAILVNALALQTGSHPAPFFSRQAVLPIGAAARPAEGTTGPALDEMGVLVRDIQVGLAAHDSYDGPTDGVLGPKTDAAIRGFQVGAGLPVDGKPTAALLARIQTSKSRPAPAGDPIAALIKANAPLPPDRRVLAVEQILASLGYGPLKVDGIPGADTRASIERFQRDRSLPADGAMSPRLLRELQAVSGQPVPGQIAE